MGITKAIHKGKGESTNDTQISWTKTLDLAQLISIPCNRTSWDIIKTQHGRDIFNCLINITAY